MLKKESYVLKARGLYLKGVHTRHENVGNDCFTRGQHRVLQESKLFFADVTI
jgi:hypothetical protein